MARKNKIEKDSPALQLLDLVWRHNCEVVPHAWERINHSMRAALELAIGAGFRFGVDDFTAIDERYRPDRWYGEQGGEQFYRLAVVVGNVSAALAWEARRQRRPLLADEVEPPDWYRGGGYIHGGGRRARERLFLGAEFTYRGQRATVTSFRTDGRVVACVYRDARRTKVARRYVLGWEEIVADRHDRQAKQELYKRLTSQPREVHDAFCRAARIKTVGDYWTTPLQRLQKVAQKVLAKAASGHTEGDTTDATASGPST